MKFHMDTGYLTICVDSVLSYKHAHNAFYEKQPLLIFIPCDWMRKQYVSSKI